METSGRRATTVRRAGDGDGVIATTTTCNLVTTSAAAEAVIAQCW
jgi:hypothetical protein